MPDYNDPITRYNFALLNEVASALGYQTADDDFLSEWELLNNTEKQEMTSMYFDLCRG